MRSVDCQRAYAGLTMKANTSIVRDREKTGSLYRLGLSLFLISLLDFALFGHLLFIAHIGLCVLLTCFQTMIGGDLEILLFLFVCDIVSLCASWCVDVSLYRSSNLECSRGSSCRYGNTVLDRANPHLHTLTRSDLVCEEPYGAAAAVNKKNNSSRSIGRQIVHGVTAAKTRR